MPASQRSAPGAPGIEPRWTSSAKDGVGTAYSTGAQVWFTLSHGIVNELYFPHVDTPNTRDLQFLITDGETFCHEEKRDLDHKVEYPERNTLLYRLTNSEPTGRYRIIKEIIVEPHSSALLIQTRVEISDPSLRGKLRIYVLLAPHLNGTGKNNSARLHEAGGRKLIHAWRDPIHLMLGCTPDFTRRSVGFAGTSDGWRDLMDNFKMDWEFESAEDGNIAVLGEVDLSGGLEFTLAVAFGFDAQTASTLFLQAMATPFAQQREKFVAQWKRKHADTDGTGYSEELASLIRLSHCVLLAHEDKLFQGAFVASLSIPWGETKDDSDRGGYHLVWTRDMVHTATALLACGESESALRALVWLASIQDTDGCLPQNSSIRGEAFWTGIQLDEVAAPILLAWHLRREDALRQFDPWTLVTRAALFLIQNGPVTGQERWEENAGYSPSTLASIIAGIVCAADFAHARNDTVAEKFLLEYADWLAGHVEEWTATSCGELVPGKPRHYIRITPAEPANPLVSPVPDTATITVANGGGSHRARNIVGGDFLQLVRLGVRAANDPLIVDSLEVIDAVLKRDLPQGPCWRRYNHDGYGQKADGSAYDGTGEGRTWPLLTGERGHYELAAGRDALPFLEAMSRFSNEGGMLPEQLWDDADLPDGRMKLGRPSGSAMPLCWSHAEYIALARSRTDGVPFDRPEPVYQRYAIKKTESRMEMWTFMHQLQSIAAGKTLRVITAAPAKVRWSADNWATVNDNDSQDTGFGCHWIDLPTQKLPADAAIVFTFQWAEKWEGRNFTVKITTSGG
ncbi:glucoamylase [Rariglobus hedericola]|uniref:Glucoamylase n=2 Tax=Rariglobus hedericola TaxID=2597822 RepID=A0A556QLN7_9BACT|nr:glucoamylase [Rariglobus hedericola]